MIRSLCGVWFVFIALLGYGADAHAQATEVHLLFMASSGTQRSALVRVLEQFEQANPDVRIVQHFDSQEEYKTNFEQRIRDKPIDIAFWFAGERMRQLVRRQLIRPLDTETVNAFQGQFTRATLASTRIGEQTYAMPLSYYAWGFFYSKSLFQELQLTPPRNWEEFLSTCNQLKARGVVPTAVGAKAGWPAAAWFDYLNLRLNGLEFHQKLLRGDFRFTDPRARAVFAQWQELLKRGYFLAEAMPLDWDGVLPYLYRRQVGMVLMGGFAAAKFPDGALGGRSVANDLGFFPFPGLNSKIGTFEDAPLDVLVMPSSGKNSAAAQRLLHFIASEAILNRYNQSIRQLSPRRDAAQTEDPFLNAGKAVLETADGIAFYFDRDARESLVGPAFDAFRQFLLPPHDIDAALFRLQAVR